MGAEDKAKAVRSGPLPPLLLMFGLFGSFPLGIRHHLFTVPFAPPPSSKTTVLATSQGCRTHRSPPPPTGRQKDPFILPFANLHLSARVPGTASCVCSERGPASVPSNRAPSRKAVTHDEALRALGATRDHRKDAAKLYLAALPSSTTPPVENFDGLIWIFFRGPLF